MAKTLDDVYQRVLWETSLTTNDLAYKYTGGGAAGFLEIFSEVYKKLVNEVVLTDTDYFLTRFAKNLTANIDIYYLPSDLLRLRHIEFCYDNATWNGGIQTDPAAFRRNSEQSFISGATSYRPYFWLGDSITSPSSPFHLAPMPTATVTNGVVGYYDQMPMGLLGAHVSAAISAASTAVVFPEQFEYLLPLGVSIEVWGRYGQLEQKTQKIEQYQQGLKDIRSLMKPRSSIGQKRVRDFRELAGRDI